MEEPKGGGGTGGGTGGAANVREAGWNSAETGREIPEGKEDATENAEDEREATGENREDRSNEGVDASKGEGEEETTEGTRDAEEKDATVLGGGRDEAMIIGETEEAVDGEGTVAVREEKVGDEMKRLWLRECCWNEGKTDDEEDDEPARDDNWSKGEGVERLREWRGGGWECEAGAENDDNDDDEEDWDAAVAKNPREETEAEDGVKNDAGGNDKEEGQAVARDAGTVTKEEDEEGDKNDAKGDVEEAG